MGSASSFSLTPGSQASVYFEEDGFVPPTAEDAKKLSPRGRRELLAAIGKSTSEACEKAGCDHVGQMWVAMPQENRRSRITLLFSQYFTHPINFAIHDGRNEATP